MDRLLIDGEVANLSVRLIFNQDAYFLLTVNTDAQQECVPGIVGFAMRIEELANEGIQCYNLGAGDFFYKVQSANRIANCQETIIFNPRSLKGTAYRAWLTRQNTPAETESQ
jgi:CelD/BcsL family acetyltransferase involved in cellulose biosynthesis